MSQSWFTFHPLTAQDRSVMAALRTMVESNKGKLRGTAVVERAVAAGIDARLDVWEGMPHGFIGIGQTQAAASALRAIGEFLSPRLAPRSGNR